MGHLGCRQPEGDLLKVHREQLANSRSLLRFVCALRLYE